MSLYRFRLQGDGERRTGAIAVPDKDLAVAILEEREADYAAYQMPPDELEQLMRAEKEQGRATGALKAHAVLHRQEKPYKIVKVEQA